MCGIIGLIGHIYGYENVFSGLKMLLNRGYDSVGICGIDNSNFLLHKYASIDGASSYDLLLEQKDKYITVNSPLISHSRWATHGPKNDINAHPHLDNTGKFAIVHNGIIENYNEIKSYLINKHNIVFKSQTDTEVIVNLISVLYDKCKIVEHAIREAFEMLQGSWAALVIHLDTPNKLFCAKKESPLLVGVGDNYYMVASEQSGFSKYVEKYFCLNDGDIMIIEKFDDGRIILNGETGYNMRQVNKEVIEDSPYPYTHWTLKEIYEQPNAIKKTLNERLLDDSIIKLKELDSKKNELMCIDNVILLGCGTSYHASLVGSHYLKQLCDFNVVQVFDGAEFDTIDIPRLGKTVAIFVSQSGETADLQRCIKICKNKNIMIIGVVNVVDSMIARASDATIYINAGKENAVASTKAFTCQIVNLCMISLWFAQNKKMNLDICQQIIDSLNNLSNDISKCIDDTYEVTKIIGKYLEMQNSLFILGKNICEPSAKEGSLKIKEIGYIHSEAYSSSALKHGPFAVIEPGLPIILISPDDEFLSKNNNTCEEVKARHAYVIGITDTKNISEKYDVVINTPKNYHFRYLISTVPLQLIAYHLAIQKGHNPDFPRHLAKSVCTI